MKEIEVVIRISEDSYKATCNGHMLPPDVENVVQGIKNGTPLPEGHGRLIDADALIRELSIVSSRPVKSQMYMIIQAPPIIEADEEEKQ